MYFVYILESISLNKLYTGHTSNLIKRFSNHNKGKQRWTKRGIPWKLIYNISIVTKRNAIRLENKLISYKNPNYIKGLINNGSIAQLARALTWRVRGRRFESYWIHIKKYNRDDMRKVRDSSRLPSTNPDIGYIKLLNRLKTWTDFVVQ